MPHPLTFEEQVIIALRRITRAADIHSHLLQREYGITGPQLSTLRVIQRLQPVTAGDLARAAHIGYATLTGILDRLEQHRHIIRERSRDDGRSVIVKMTKPGERLLATAPSLLQTRLREELETMPDSRRKTLLSSLLKIADLMEAETQDE